MRMQLGQYEQAGRFAMEALTIYHSLGMETEHARAEWMLAHLMLRQGHVDRAEIALRAGTAVSRARYGT